jgi:hypothetical protein
MFVKPVSAPTGLTRFFPRLAVLLHIYCGQSRVSIFLLFLLAASLTGVAQPATQLVITTQPVPGTNGGLMSVQPVVEIRDASNQLVTGSTAQVQIVLSTGTGGSIGGTTMIQAVNGVATFTDLTFTSAAGQSYTFGFISNPVIAAEPFSYTGGSTLTGQNGGIGWSGAWFAPNPAFVASVIDAAGLSYTGLTSSGGRAVYSSGTGGDGGRLLAAASNASYHVVWLAFLGNYTSQGGGFNSFRLLMNAGSTVSGGIGGNGGYTNWTILDNTLSNTAFTTAALDGTTRLALLKIDYTGGQSSLWMDPVIASFDGTQTPSITASFAPVFDRIDFYNRSTGVSTDEITLASTYKAALHLEQDLTPATSVVVTLPVHWTFFTANCHGDQTLLEWGTAGEFNNGQFIVEKSYDARNWLPIGKLDGAGNSEVDHDYQFKDSAASAKTYYRLEQLDLDGHAHFSNVVSASCGTSGINTLTIFPNPAHAILQFKGGQTGLPYQLTDMGGRSVRTGVVQSGITTISLANLPIGNYFLTLKGGQYQPVQIMKTGQ